MGLVWTRIIWWENLRKMKVKKSMRFDQLANSWLSYFELVYWENIELFIIIMSKK